MISVRCQLARAEVRAQSMTCCRNLDEWAFRTLPPGSVIKSLPAILWDVSIIRPLLIHFQYVCERQLLSSPGLSHLYSACKPRANTFSKAPKIYICFSLLKTRRCLSDEPKYPGCMLPASFHSQRSSSQVGSASLLASQCSLHRSCCALSSSTTWSDFLSLPTLLNLI